MEVVVDGAGRLARAADDPGAAGALQSSDGPGRTVRHDLQWGGTEGPESDQHVARAVGRSGWRVDDGAGWKGDVGSRAVIQRFPEHPDGAGRRGARRRHSGIRAARRFDGQVSGSAGRREGYEAASSQAAAEMT